MPVPGGLWLNRGGAPPALVAGVAGVGGVAGRPCVPHVAASLAAGCQGAPRALQPRASWCSWALGAVQGVSGQPVSFRCSARPCAPHPGVPSLACPRTPWPTTARLGRLSSTCPGARATWGMCAQAPGVVARWGKQVGLLAWPPPPFPSAFTTRGPGYQAPGQRRGRRLWVPLSPVPPARARGHFSGGVSSPRPLACERQGGVRAWAQRLTARLRGRGPACRPGRCSAVVGGGGARQGGLACSTPRRASAVLG